MYEKWMIQSNYYSKFLLAISITLYLISKQKEYLELIFYWMMVSFVFVVQGMFQAHPVQIALAFTVSVIPIFYITWILLSIIDRKLSIKLYLGLIFSGLVATILLYWLNVPFKIFALPLSMAVASPFFEGIYWIFFKKRKSTTKIQKFLAGIMVAGIIHCVNFALYRMEDGAQIWGWMVSFILYQMFSVLLPVFVVERITKTEKQKLSKANEKLVAYQTQLKHLSSALSLTEERERRHISEDLHDRIGQTLTVIKMKLEELRNPQVDTDSVSVLNETGELLDNAIHDTRTLTFEISPPILYELGFESAVEWLIEQFRERHNIPIEYEGNGDGMMLDDDLSFFLFKSVRELLFNAIKYAKAGRIKVLVRREKNGIRISIEDDGVGFDFSKVQFSLENLTGFGLFSIRERMEHFGGHLVVKSKPGQGTHMALVTSLKRREEDRDAKV
jgi:signal transduction histidine kinase